MRTVTHAQAVSPEIGARIRLTVPCELVPSELMRSPWKWMQDAPVWARPSAGRRDAIRAYWSRTPDRLPTAAGGST